MYIPEGGNVGTHLRILPSTPAVIPEIPTFRFSLRISEDTNILTDLRHFIKKQTTTTTWQS